jgi:hypothetical protein
VLWIGVASGDLVRVSARGLLGFSAGPTVLDGEPGWSAFLGLGLAQAYLAVMRFLLYVDCRTRREGWDLQVQMSALVQVARSRGLGASKEAA